MTGPDMKKIEFQIQDRDVTILDDGPLSKGDLGIDDKVLVDGKEISLAEEYEILTTIIKLTSQIPYGISFDDLKSYLQTLNNLHDSQYPVKPDAITPNEHKFDAKEFSRLLKKLGLEVDYNDENIDIPEIMFLAVEARQDVNALAKKLEGLDETERILLLEVLLNNFSSRPIRTYEKDEGKRFDEIIVGRFTNWEKEEPFPVSSFIKKNLKGRINWGVNKAGKSYWKRFCDYAKKMGKTKMSQEKYFSNPYRLALILRSLVAPKITYHKDENRYYNATPMSIQLVENTAFYFGKLSFYGLDYIFPKHEVIDSVALSLSMVVHNLEDNLAHHIVFTPEIHGERLSLAAQNIRKDELPMQLGFFGDYLKVGLDAHRRPACTAIHESGHQKYWQEAEDINGKPNKVFIAKVHELYVRAMKTDGGEIINDSTYTGLLGSGHPYKFIEFFPAAHHAFIEHADELAARIAATPKGHYSRDLWKFLKNEVYGMVYTSNGKDPVE